MLGDIADASVDQGGPIGDPFRYVDISSIDNRTKQITDPKVLQLALAPSRARQRLQTGDVLVSMTRPNLNAVAMVPAELHGAVGSTGFCVLRAVDVAPQWLYYAVQTSGFISAMCGVVQGALYPAVRPKDVLRFRIPIAPAAEQGRIVAAIEEHVSRLDPAVTGLKRAQALIPRYRAAVLKAAVEEAIRCGDVQWVPLEDCALRDAGSITDGPFGSNLKTEHYTESGARVIRLQNIGDGVFNDERAYVSMARFAQLSRHEVKPGDVLIAALGQRLPRACLAPLGLGPAIVKADCFRLRPNLRVVSPGWLNIVLNAEPTRDKAGVQIKGVGRPRLNLSAVRLLQVPLPAMAVQRRIVADVERRLTVVQALRDECRIALARAAQVHHSILKRGFEGKLVPQNPNDEPASVLLERIRAGRASAPARPKRSRRRG
jgi:type I restriction enzyme, S subunit